MADRDIWELIPCIVIAVWSSTMKQRVENKIRAIGLGGSQRRRKREKIRERGREREFETKRER